MAPQGVEGWGWEVGEFLHTAAKAPVSSTYAAPDHDLTPDAPDTRLATLLVAHPP